MPQINLCLLLGEKSGLFLYYEGLNGSIKDVNTLECVLKMLDWLNVKGLHVVMDRGFYSECNIGCLYVCEVLFTVGVSFTAWWSREFVARVWGGVEKFGNFHRVGGCRFFAVTDVTSWMGRVCFRHVYYDTRVSHLKEFHGKI